MTDALSIALSGLTAQKQRLAATASNVANVSTGGSIPSADPSAPAPSGGQNQNASTVYRPLQASLTSVTVEGAGAGVAAEITEKPNGYSVIYDPSSPFASAEGFSAVPNVDLAEEAVNLLQTRAAYKANLSVIKTQDEMMGDLLDTLA